MWGSEKGYVRAPPSSSVWAHWRERMSNINRWAEAPGNGPACVVGMVWAGQPPEGR